MSEPAAPLPPAGPPPNPNLVDLIRVIAEKIDPIIKMYSTAMEHRQAAESNEKRFRLKMSWVALSFVAFIVAIAAFLTYRGKIDGSTFTFLLGLIVGYLLTFVRDQITGPE